jgi:hypothetical protein
MDCKAFSSIRAFKGCQIFLIFFVRKDRRINALEGAFRQRGVMIFGAGYGWRCPEKFLWFR